MEHVVAVHPDCTSLESAGYLERSVEVGRVDSSSETVRGIVASLDGFFLGLELGNGAHRAEDLLLDDLHVFGDIREDGRFDEVTLGALALTTSLNGGASLLAVLDVAAKTLVDSSPVGHHGRVQRTP